MARSEFWNRTVYYPLAISDPKSNPALIDAINSSPEKLAESDRSMTRAIVGAAREVILCKTGDSIKFIVIGIGLSARNGALEIARTWEIRVNDFDEATVIVATALTEMVPVHPEDDESGVLLVKIHQSILDEGFVAKREDGTVQRYRLGGGLVEYSPSGEPTVNSAQPAEILLAGLREDARRRETEEAHRIVLSLRSGIEELASLLDSELRDEAALQGCLTRNPTLFGLHYRRVIPKYRLGSEYEMDYALEHVSGLVDLVEIEPSNFRLYTTSGNPRAELVHAEQQVLDWIEWIERHGEYARSGLPGILRPRAYVVIGRRTSLSSDDRRRLARRNATWGDSLQILTFDDLLDEARNVLHVLSALSAGGDSSVLP